jgi:GNAT superfamily N-acetyltransferase
MGDADPARGKTEAPGTTAAGASVETLVTYLEMRASPDGPAMAPPRPGLEIRRAMRPTTSFYRYLYDAVGGPWTWTERRLMSDEALAAIVQDPRVELLVLWVDGVPAGYAELDRRAPPDIELAYFGLIPEFMGQGLGWFLLDHAVRRAWSYEPARLWVHTCDLDHPRALGVYEKCGFGVYDRRMGRVTLPA